MLFLVQQSKQPVPVISLVQSLSTRRAGRQPYNPITNRRTGSPIPVPELTVQLERLSDLPARVKVSSLSSLTGSTSWTPISSGTTTTRVENKTQVVTVPALPKQVGNKSTMCKAITLNKAINCIPITAEAECQTEDWLENRMFVPVPIPIYIPQPMYMYNLPTPIPGKIISYSIFSSSLLIFFKFFNFSSDSSAHPGTSFCSNNEEFCEWHHERNQKNSRENANRSV